LRLDIRESAFAEHNGYASSSRQQCHERLFRRSARRITRFACRGLVRQKPDAKQIELFRQWIDQGAKWQSMGLRSPNVQHTEVKTNLAEESIDNFTLARWRRGLKLR